jgi:hypothetical protein
MIFSKLKPLNPQQNCWHIEINPQSDRLLSFMFSNATPEGEESACTPCRI